MNRRGGARGVKRECACPRAKHVHGTRRAYEADGCRCLPCRAANARAKYNYMHGQSTKEGYRIPNVGTQRRLRALYAAGWTWTVIGDRLGLRVQSIREIAGLSKQHPWEFCYAETARQVAELYDELSALPSPEGTAALRARLGAQRKGWLPPAAWDADDLDDPTAISVETDPATLSRDDRVRLAVRLVEYGATQRQAAKRCGVDDEAIRKMMRGEAA